jgi:hypothetical protein
MPAQVARLELWSTLQSISGATLLAPDIPWDSLVETTREEGDDSLVCEFPLTHPAALLADEDMVLCVVGGDGSIAEYRIAVVEWRVHDGMMAITAASARTILSGASVTTTLTMSGDSPSTMLTIIRSGCAGWPASVTVGTVQPTTPVDLTVQAGTNGLAAVLQLVAAIDATLSSGAPPCVLRFRRVSSSSWVMDILTTVPAGTVHLLEGKNLPTLTKRKDKTSGTSVTSYQFEVTDLFRTRPDVFTRDKLTVYETARFESRTLGVDTTERISELVTDYTQAKTRVQLGEPRQRLSRQVEDIALAVVPVPPNLTIVPGTVTTTTQPYTVTATVPSGTVRIQVTPRGTTATGSSYGPITDGFSITAIQGEEITVDRPPVGQPAGSLIIEAFGSSGGAQAQVLTIEPQTQPILLTITGSESAADDDDVTVEVVGADPTGLETVTVTHDGAGAVTDLGSDHYEIVRPDEGDPPLLVTFTATAANRVSQTWSITVTPKSGGGGGGTIPPSIDFFLSTGANVGTNEITFEWGASNEPSGVNYDLEYTARLTDPSTGLVTDVISDEVTNITTPYDLTPGFTLIAKFGTDWQWVYLTARLKMRDGASLLKKTAETSLETYGVYVP